MSLDLGVIGFGNMGAAIVNGLIAGEAIKSTDIGVFDSCNAALQTAQKEGLRVYNSAEEIAKSFDTVLIAVKPVHAKALFSEIGKYVRGKLIISIVAGLAVKRIKEWCGCELRVLRIMPNTPAMVGEGVFALDADTDALASEKERVEEIFSSIGMVEWVEERLFAVVTGLSGGGPAYVAMFIEALSDAGVLHGLKREVAVRMAVKTVLGSAAQILKTHIHPAMLKDMVCSPDGTTIEGVRSLEEHGLRAGVMEAVSSAVKKAGKL